LFLVLATFSLNVIFCSSSGVGRAPPLDTTLDLLGLIVELVKFVPSCAPQLEGILLLGSDSPIYALYFFIFCS